MLILLFRFHGLCMAFRSAAGRSHLLHHIISALKMGSTGLLVLFAGCQSGPTPLPLVGNPFHPVEPTKVSVGDSYVYRFLDGYGNLAPSQVTYRVNDVGADRIVMSVTPESSREGHARTEIYTRNGNWLRRPVLSHNQPLDREFSPAYPAYVFPLAPGKSWSIRVTTINPANKQESESLIVKGQVIGAERIRVPAGEFDTIKVKRHIFIDDIAGFMNFAYPTHVTETDWYSPTLGRVVRSESDSDWLTSGQSPQFSQTLGDWNVYELVSLPASAP